MKSKMLMKALILAVLFICNVFGNAEKPKDGNKPEVQIEILKAPPKNCVQKSKSKNVLKVHYEGYLEDGTKFESSYKEDKPIFFQLDAGTVIRGWEKGLRDMCVGEKRKLVIPPRFGFGKRQNGVIPPGSTLTFEVELLEIKATIGVATAFQKLDENSDGYLDMKELRTKMDEIAQSTQMPMQMDESMRYKMVQMIFQSADKDRDGLLTEGEFGKIPGIGKFLKGAKKDEL